MTTLAHPGRRVPLAPAPITRDALDAMLRAGGFLPVTLHETVVIASRPIAGHPYEAREVVFHCLGSAHGWLGALFHRRLGQPIAQGGVVTPALHQSPVLATLDDAECWLGGVCSVPISRQEVAALAGSA